MDAAEANEKKKKLAMVGVSALVLVAMVAAVGMGVSEGFKKSDDCGLATSNRAIRNICQPTDYRQTCEESLASSDASEASDPMELIQTAFHVAAQEIQMAVSDSPTLRNAYKDPQTRRALETCRELVNYAIGDLDRCIAHMGKLETVKLTEYVDDLKVWLSGALTYQEECLDAFENTTVAASEDIKNLLTTSRMMTSNGLAMASEVSKISKSLNLSALAGTNPTQRRLLLRISASYQGGGFLPAWASQERRRLLVEGEVKADAVVAKDGSGKYKTVNEALRDVPVDDGNKTYVIRIKEGEYEEKVHVGASMKNLVFIGDGPTKTKITGRLNFQEGMTAYRTATVAVMGDAFTAKDIGFENSAGADKGPAVALLVQSDHSIFQNCQIDGHTNTLNALNYRQFFRDCTISGALDFLTGDAAALFQNCRLVVRAPNPDGDASQCSVTAHSRSDKREPSGFVLQNCTVTADPDYLPVKDKIKTYLGRPKKLYSSTVVMESQIDDVIAAEGWAPFRGTPGMDTCFYAEYKNRGPGSGQDGRVKWPGIQRLQPPKIEEFTGDKFIGGDTWIKPAGVPYAGGMMDV